MTLKGPPYISEFNSYVTDSLFHDRNKPGGPFGTVFTLTKDRQGLINVRKSFVAMDDVTGYNWALKYLKSWEHFTVLMTRPWFSDVIEGAIAEIEVKILAQAISGVKEMAHGDTSVALAAIKYLTNKEYKGTRGRGRPSKQDINNAIKEEAQRQKIIEDDFERITAPLTVINGGKA